MCFAAAAIIMVRTYVKKPGSRQYAAFNSADMEVAVNKVRSGEMSIRRACAHYSVPRSTLHNRVKGVHNLKAGHQTVFTEAEEKSLVHHIQVVSQWGFPFTTLDMRMVAKRMLYSAGKNIKCFKNNVPSAELARLFLKRYASELTQRSCQNIKRVRASVSPDQINQYFDNLTRSLKNTDGSEIPPHCVFNYDETNLTDDPGLKKCVFKRGVKYPERIKDSSKSSTSVMFCGSAAGNVLPPYVVYKSDHLWDLWTQGGLKGARYNRSKSGWFDAVTFQDWFHKLFVPYAKRLGQRVVLIGDNLASHFSDGVLRAAQENNISFVCLPKNSTHLCQPLDVAFYRPLKMKWRAILDDWKQKNVRKCSVSKDHFPGLLRKLCISLCGDDEGKLVSQNLVAGFRKCGIVPLNRTEVLSRLPPSSPANQSSFSALQPPEKIDTGAAAAVSSAVLDHLSGMRYGNSEQPRQRKRARLNVEPGCSISFEDLNSNITSTSTPKDAASIPTRKGVKSKKAKQANKKRLTKTKTKPTLRRKILMLQDVEPSSEDEFIAASTAEAQNDTSEDSDVEDSVRRPTEKSSGMVADPQPMVVQVPVADNNPHDAVRQTASVPVLPVKSFYRRKPCSTTSIPANSTGVGITREAGAGQKRKISLPAKYRE